MRELTKGMLVVGASGFVGSHIFQQAQKNGFKVSGTFNHPKNETSGLLKLDLSEKRPDIRLPEDIVSCALKTAVICSAVSKIDDCARDKARSYQINVDNTQRLINQLSNMGFKIVFFSSDHVFDGSRGLYTEKDQRSPVNEYGRQKKKAEDFICSNIDRGLVMRISKVCSSDSHEKNLLNEWLNLVKEKKDILCIKNNVFSPTSREDIWKALTLAIQEDLFGVYNVAGAAWKRSELAECFVECANARMTSRVVEKDMKHFNFLDPRPLNSSLNNKKFLSRIHFEFKPMKKIVSNFLDQAGG